jgi:hypothetical protein
MDRKFYTLLFVSLFLSGMLVACGGRQVQPAPVLTPPAISLEITSNSCPSIEARAGMEIAWTNRDNVDRMLWLERKDERGVIIDAGGTDLLQPGTTFSIVLTEPGQYTYFCSKDRSAFGTIVVLP